MYAAMFHLAVSDSIWKVTEGDKKVYNKLKDRL